MSSFDLGGVLQAIRSAASTYLASGGGLVIGETAGSRSLPYAVLRAIDSTPWRTFGEDGFRMRVQVSTYGSREAGPVAVSASAATLRSLLSRSRPSVPGIEITGVEYDIERPPFRESERWRVDQDFIVYGREAP